MRPIGPVLVGALLVGALVAPVGVLASGGPPVAVDDYITTPEDTVATGNVLANDSDPDLDTLTVFGFVPVPSVRGVLAIASDGAYTFTPAANWNGPVFLAQYTVSDGTNTRNAYIHITVTAVNDPPVAVGQAASTTEDTPVNISAATLLTGATDVENDSLSVTGVSNATLGAAVLSSGVVAYTPTANACGTGGFDFTVSDGNGGTDTRHVTIAIACVNDLPVVVADTRSGTEDTTLVLGGADLTANDTDVEGSTLTVNAIANVVGGNAVLSAGTVTFTPTANLCGSSVARFDYKATDGTGTSATWAQVTISLTCVNDAPVTVADTGMAAQGSGAADYDVLANDSDAEGSSISLVSAAVPASAGTASVASGKVRFAPLATFHGEAVITYVITDGTDTGNGTLTVTVGPDTTAPVAVAPTVTFGSGRVNESAPLLISWSATDAGSGVASYTVQASVSGGAFTTIYTGSATSVTKPYAFGKSLIWRVSATDAEGNTSGWATSAVRQIIAYQAPGSTAVGYSSSWTTVTAASSSGVGYRYTTTSGQYAQLTFTGREVLFVAPKTSASGYVKVYVDGAYKGRLREYAATTAVGQILSRHTWSTSAAHKIRIVNDQAGKRTNLDAFIVLR